jgi:hypothetical protein
MAAVPSAASLLAQKQLTSLVNSGGNPSPFLFPDQWDRVSFAAGAFVWEGKVHFRGAKRAFNWDIKTPKGINGEVYTYRGLHTRPFQMRLECWTDAQWQKLPTLLSFFNYDTTIPNAGSFANPIDIYHPALSLLHIAQVLCLDIDAPEVDQERGGQAWITFTLREFHPVVLPTNVTSTPTSTQVPLVVLNSAGGSSGAEIASQQQQIQTEGQNLGVSGVLP